jgi:hypothetical protein
VTALYLHKTLPCESTQNVRGDGYIAFLFKTGFYRGTSTIPNTSSMTVSGPTPSNAAVTASRSLPHCILLSLAGSTISMRCGYIFLAAKATRVGVTKVMPCSEARHLFDLAWQATSR